MRYFVEVLLTDGTPVLSKDVVLGIGGATSRAVAVDEVSRHGARDTIYWVIAESKDAGTREVVAVGKPGLMKLINPGQKLSPPDPGLTAYVEERFRDAQHEPARIIEERSLHPGGLVTERSWCDVGPLASGEAPVYRKGDKVRVTYETTVLQQRRRPASGEQLVAVKRPGSRLGCTTVPVENVMLISPAVPEWWPPRVGDVVACPGWGQGIVTRPEPEQLGSFAVYQPYNNMPGGHVTMFSLIGVDPLQWVLVAPCKQRMPTTVEGTSNA